MKNEKVRMMLNDECVFTGNQQTKVINPATKEVITSIALSDIDDVNKAVINAQQAFSEWSNLDQAERGKRLHKIADAIEAAQADLAETIVAEQGKPMPLAMMEVGGAIGWTRYHAELEIPVEVLEDSPQRKVEVHRKPVGVVASITPWNWPLMIACWHIMPALKAGNTVVIKPSTFTPLSTLKLVEIINQALPEKGVVNFVLGEKDVGEALVQHALVNKVVFTGSTLVGKHIAGLISSTLKKVTLELGGNDAGIVLKGADISKIAEPIFNTAFVNMGQTCAALKRLYVHRSQYHALSDALVELAMSQKVGDGMQDGVSFGPVQNAAQFNKVSELISEAEAAGAEVLSADLPAGLQGYFIAPTIVKGALTTMRVVSEEQFGPVLPIIVYDELDDAITQATNTDFALGGSVWGEPGEEMDYAVGQLDSGTVWINNHAEVLPHVPFGGNKSSGYGVEFGLEGLLENTVRKVVNLTKS